jgi:integrase
MNNSTRPRRRRNHQSAKPHPDYPLTAHPSGRWCKKIKGRLHYFGPLADPQAALDLWLKRKDDLLAGRTPRDDRPDAATLRQLANAYLAHKQAGVNNGELSPRTFDDCYRTCARLLEFFGKHRQVEDLSRDDFTAYRGHLAKSLGLISLGNEVQRVRSLFKFALESGLTKTPTLFGVGFKRPTRKTLRLERARKGPRLFAAEELRKLIAAAPPTMRAMILLACNAGLGNSDLAAMPIEAVNLETGWVDYPRVKTGAPRRFPLWQETKQAVAEALAARPTPKDAADAALLFLTKRGARFCKATAPPNGRGDDEAYHSSNVNSVTTAFNVVCRHAAVERKGRSFYTIRHVFETVAGDSRDQVGVDHVMGHARDDMASVYREKVSDERVKAVCEHVHGWLYPPKKAKTK